MFVRIALPLTVFCSLAAFAEKPAGSVGPAAPDPAVLKAKRDALKHQEGNWSCDGKVQRPEGEAPMSFTAVHKPTPDGAWLHTTKDWSKPTARHQQGFMGWDTATSTYRTAEVTSEGTMVICSSADISTANVVWTCEGTFQGKPAQRKMTSTVSPDKKQVDTVGEVQLPDGTWKKMVQSTCKKK